MGGVSSQSSMVKNTLSAINETMLSVINTTRNEMSQSCSTVQNISVTIKGNVKIDTLKTNQIATVSCTFTGTSLTDMTAKMQTEMTNKIDQFIAQSTKSTQEFLSLSANQQDSSISNSTYVKNSINQAISNSITNVCSQNLSLTQGQPVVIENYTQWTLEIKSVDLNQNLQALAISTCAMNSIISTLSDNKQLNDIAQKIDQSTVSEQTGLSSLMGPLIIILLLVGGGFLLVSGKGMELIQNPKKLLIVCGVIIVLYLGLSYMFGWTPFKKSEGYNLSLGNIVVKPYKKYNESLNAVQETSFGAF